MRIINDWLTDPVKDRPKVVVTVGVFDGLHLGHQYLIRKVIERASQLGVESLVLTFDPHPLSVLSPASAPDILTTFDQKSEFLSSFALNHFARLVFDEKLRDTSSEEFLSNVLTRMAEPVEIVIGADFRFGRNAEGQESFLRTWARARQIGVSRVELQQGHDVVYSSSHIRSLLKVGLVEAAAASLGRCYRLSGEVVYGAARGRNLGFPTANLGQIRQLIPGPGVYAVLAHLKGKSFKGMTSIGHNPTFGSSYLTVETNLFDYSEDCYGEKLEVDFVRHLRGMMRFDGPAKLKERLSADEKVAREILADHGK
ncbi:MAG: riboflavin biosynthesis protein RibF [Deltaproteobacteria bacterium]|jgi:riboflavin kinase/FMN adenylyltransferase|nr:riboflavin biosynthesis protein RibF [Deltaproteobacteria bacterium]